MAWDEERLAYVRALSGALLEFGRAVFTRGTISDVVAWSLPDERDDYSKLYVAFVGDGLKVAREFGYFTPPGADVDLGTSGARIAYGFKKYLGAEQAYLGTRHDHVTLSDFLDRVGGQVAGEFAEHSFDEVDARMILEPGYPWPENDAPGLVYWSAKVKKLIKPERPGWLIKVADRDDPSRVSLGVNPCVVFPPEPVSVDDASWGLAGKFPVIVAHSMSLLASEDDHAFPYIGPPKAHSYKHVDTAAHAVKACGGLLFPSFSVGPIPASNYGPISLVGHLGLVLDGLSPMGTPSKATSWVYEHDAWTVTTSELMREVAIRLFDEFHGAGDYIYGYHIWALGPPAELYGGPSEGSTPVRSFSQLLRAMKQRSSRYSPRMTRHEFEEMSKQVAGTVDKYVYCEAKARRVISLDEFPYLVGPDTLEERIHRFAKIAGYKGEIVLIPDSIGVVASENTDERDYTHFRWAWIMADAIRELSPPLKLPTR